MLSRYSERRNVHHHWQLVVLYHNQGSQVILEGGRYKLISDGDNNNMIMMAITKVKASDEAEYRLTIENCHGKDEATFMLYVSGKLNFKFLFFRNFFRLQYDTFL